MEDFQKKDLQFFHLKINSLLPKIDEICLIEKPSITSIIRIGECKVDSSILNNEADIEAYNVIRMDCSRRSGVACYIRKESFWHFLHNWFYIVLLTVEFIQRVLSFIGNVVSAKFYQTQMCNSQIYYRTFLHAKIF